MAALHANQAFDVSFLRLCGLQEALHATIQDRPPRQLDTALARCLRNSSRARVPHMHQFVDQDLVTKSTDLNGTAKTCSIQWTLAVLTLHIGGCHYYRYYRVGKRLTQSQLEEDIHTACLRP